MRTSLRDVTAAKLGTKDNHYCFGAQETAMYFMSKLNSSVKLDSTYL